MSDITIAAIKRLINEHDVTIRKQQYRRLPNYQGSVVERVEWELLLPRGFPKVYIHELAMIRELVTNMDTGALMGGTGAHTEYLVEMKKDWLAWTPSRIKLNDDDIYFLTCNLIGGERLWFNVRWRLYGAGFIDIKPQVGNNGDMYWHVTVTDSGKAAYEAKAGKTVEEMLAQRTQEAEEKRLYEERHYIRISPVYTVYSVGIGEPMADFTVDVLPGLVVTVNLKTDYVQISGGLRRDEMYKYGKFHKFITGVDALASRVRDGKDVRYSIQHERLELKQGDGSWR